MCLYLGIDRLDQLVTSIMGSMIFVVCSKIAPRMYIPLKITMRFQNNAGLS